MGSHSFWIRSMSRLFVFRFRLQHCYNATFIKCFLSWKTYYWYSSLATWHFWVKCFCLEGNIPQYITKRLYIEKLFCVLSEKRLTFPMLISQNCSHREKKIMSTSVIISTETQWELSALLKRLTVAVHSGLLTLHQRWYHRQVTSYVSKLFQVGLNNSSITVLTSSFSPPTEVTICVETQSRKCLPSSPLIGWTPFRQNTGARGKTRIVNVFSVPTSVYWARCVPPVCVFVHAHTPWCGASCPNMVLFRSEVHSTPPWFHQQRNKVTEANPLLPVFMYVSVITVVMCWLQQLLSQCLGNDCVEFKKDPDTVKIKKIIKLITNSAFPFVRMHLH